MRSSLTAWLLLFGLLLQSVAWALPAQRAGQAEQLAHAWAHVIDHGHHPHEAADGADAPDAADMGSLLSKWYSADNSWGHDRDPALDLGEHGPHHVHASEAGQVQGLPVPTQPASLHLPNAPPEALALLPPSSADPDKLLRPPQALA